MYTSIRAAAVLLLLLMVALPCLAQAVPEFYQPKSLTTGGMTMAVPAGDMGCAKFTLATPQEVFLEVSTSTTSCQAVSALLHLYKLEQDDPDLTIASSFGGASGTTDCARIIRRLYAGSYKACIVDSAARPLAVKLRYLVQAPASTPTNDTCGTAQLLTGSSGKVTSTTRSAINDHSPLGVGVCAPVKASRGPDRVWAVDLSAGQTLGLTLAGAGADAALYLVDDCSKVHLRCLAAAQTGSSSVESLSYQNTGTTTKRVFIVVDSRYSEQPLTTFTLDWMK